MLTGNGSIFIVRKISRSKTGGREDPFDIEETKTTLDNARITSRFESLNDTVFQDASLRRVRAESSEDVAETIAKAEMLLTTNHKVEVELLKKGSEFPFEELLKAMPLNYVEERKKRL